MSTVVKWFANPDGSYSADVRRNFFANALDGAFFAFGLSFVAVTTVLPLFVKKIGGSNIAVGLIPVVWTLGFNFPQIFVANFTERFDFKRGLFLKTAFIQRMPWMLLALLSFLVITKVDAVLGLTLFFAGYGLAAVGGALNMPVWFDLISKITPVQLRGKLFALRAIGGALLGILGGYTAERVLNSMDYPQNFAFLFTLAFAAFMMSYLCLLFLKEDEPNPGNRRRNYREYVSDLPRILREQKNFRNFLIADAMLIVAMVAEAFFSVSGLERFDLPEGHAGRFTMVIMVSMVTSNFFFGHLADRYGHKLNLLLAAVFAATACLLAVIAASVTVYYIVFVLIALTAALKHVSRLTIIAELCSPAERPTYVALTNMVTSPFILVGIFAGWVADNFGYNSIFVFSGIFAVAAAVCLLKLVQEPRKQDRRFMLQKAQVNV